MTPQHRRPRRRSRALAATLPLLAFLLPASSAASGIGPGAVTVTKTVSRVHLDNGAAVVADRRKVTVHVGQTQGLHDRQVISVSWSGAHPTSNGSPDPNAGAARTEEYPVVLMECRGLASASAPKAKQITPQTCWTQTAPERYIFSPNLAFPPWRVDRYAARADRERVSGAPKTLPQGCYSSGYPEHWLPFVGVSGKRFDGGPNGCAGVAPEATDIDSSLALPGNTTYAVTGADGRGAAKFDVWTGLNNASLGCGPAVPCSLVVIPIEGISCDVAAHGLPSRDVATGDDATAAKQACEATGGHTIPDVAVEGALWWSASNWRNRITIPLGFAPLPTSCGLVAKGSSAGVSIYGSELMTAAAQQWSSKFCADPKLFPLTHVQTGEPQARNLLATGNVDAAFTTFTPPSGYATPVVSAPVAFSGFAIGYDVDDANGHEYTHLRLDARLLAKLLTESYPSISAIQQDDADLSHNPLNITTDPEFIALNPGIPHGVTAGQSAATLYALSSDSDVMHALTSYINADPDARAWLNGAADPWGMTVNPRYKGMTLPVDSWPLLDTFEPTSIYDNGSNDCLHDNPVPYLPLVAAPTSRLATISLGLQFSIAPSQVVCQLVTGGGTAGERLVALGRQTIGNRFLIGLTSVADAARYGIDTAALQTRVASSAPAAFTDGTGRSFVAPTDASLRAAAALLRPAPKAGTWQLPYSKLTGANAVADAYPGAMLISTSVPSGGLPKAEAHNYAEFLRFAAGAGQASGGGVGQLPAGYLPLTAANGLGAQAAYTLRAADAVAAQSGALPSLTHAGPRPPSSPGGSGGPGGPLTGPGSGPPVGSVPTGSTPVGAGSGTTTPAAGPPATTPVLAVAHGVTAGGDGGLRGGLVALLALLAAAGMLSAGLIGQLGRVRR
ncbi:MAG: hypothetical protein JO222_03100 [Frankiales bacterium]|nr:hypothetical protein [Frankiales bacterium]